MLLTSKDGWLRPAVEFTSRPWETYTPTAEVHREVLRESAEARGLEVRRLSQRVMVISAHDKEVLFTRRMSEATSIVSREVTNDKVLTKLYLDRAGISTPSGQVFESDERKAGWQFAKSLDAPVVVKPFKGSGGRGITTAIRDRVHFKAAWKETRRRQVIVEEYIPGHDHRFFVVDRHVAAVARRWPAYVTGDGTATISELIDAKNEVRSRNPYAGAKPIKITPMIAHYLSQADLTPGSVPDAGQHVQLHPVSNVGAGGESEDYTDQVHPGFFELAVRAKEAIPGMFHGGVDLIAEDITGDPDSQRWAVCEVNSNPDIALHHFPVHGMARDTAGSLLDALFTRIPGRRFRLRH